MLKKLQKIPIFRDHFGPNKFMRNFTKLHFLALVVNDYTFSLKLTICCDMQM